MNTRINLFHKLSAQFLNVVGYGINSSRSRFISTNNKIIVGTEQMNNGLRRIILNDMKTRNSLSLEMMTEITDSIRHNKSDSQLRAITIESCEGPVFSAGHNLKELTSERGIKYQRAIFSKCTEMMIAIRESEVPVIAIVNGLAAAAGCQLVSACDFSLATSKSTFSTPGANVGLFCSTPGVGISRAMNRNCAAFMVLTGIPISAEEASKAGLVTKVVAPEQLEQTLQEIYSSIKSKSRPVLQLGKEFFYRQFNHSYETAMKMGEEIMVKNLQYSDCQEGLLRFKEKKKLDK